MNSVHSYGFVGEDLAVRMRERVAGLDQDKETDADEAGKEFEGGSMQLMAYSLKAMEITRERVYELMELLD